MSWKDRANSWVPLKVHFAIYSIVFIGFIILASVYSYQHSKLVTHDRYLAEVDMIVAEAVKKTSETRYEVDLQVCRNGKQLRRDILIVTDTLEDLVTVILAPSLDPDVGPPTDRRAQQLNQEFRRAQAALLRSERRLIQELKRNCVTSVRRPNGEEERLDEVIDPPPSSPIRPSSTTVTRSTTVVSPTTTVTRTETEPGTTETVTETVTETTTGVVTVVPPAVTETVTQTVTETTTTTVPGPVTTQTETVTGTETVPPGTTPTSPAP